MSEENEKTMRLKHQLSDAMGPVMEKLESLEKEVTSLRKEQEKLNEKLDKRT